MLKSILALAIFLVGESNIFCLEQLDKTYLVCYGNPQAPIKVTKFYSFLCPNCLELYKRHFKEVKSSYIDTEQIFYTFHPLPKDKLTLFAMDCLEKLTNEKEKQAFLEIMLEEIDAHDFEYSLNLMKRAMEILKKPLPQLSEEAYFVETRAYKDAFKFLTTNETISAVPTVSVNEKYYPREVPDLQFIEQIVKEHNNKEKKDAIKKVSAVAWSYFYDHIMPNVQIAF